LEIEPVSRILSTKRLCEPVLNALAPNGANYRVLIMQPRGEIEASIAGVSNRNRARAISQFGRFLDEAFENHADLVATPEYSMPWEALVLAIKGGQIPEPGKIWVLGCESMRIGDLERIKEDLAQSAEVIHEDLHWDHDRFVSPLAYVFVAPQINEPDLRKTVLLIQFKTHPMGDKDHFEINGLQRGARIYEFGGPHQGLRLVSLICSDAFAFEDADARSIYDRALILHLQLNPSPRHEQFVGCRERLLRYGGDATEILCLNWAANVQQCSGDKVSAWCNISGSAWYLKPNEFDDRDVTLCANHRRGLYYTWLQPRRAHALFFNFEGATYLLDATKVAHVGVPGAVSSRRGPQVRKVFIWSDREAAWIEQAKMEDGFNATVVESGDAKDELGRIAERNPLEAERVLALSAGKIDQASDWYLVRHLDSCVLEATEIIRRITFCQDTNEQARDFRVGRLRRFGRLWEILKTAEELPPALADLREGFRFEWSENFPHQNAISAGGRRATVIYMGEEYSSAQLEIIAKKAAEYLHRASSNADKSISARQRLAIWFRDGNQVKLHDSHRYVRFDQTGESSEFDLGRER
jgi:hypothetical protein